MSTKNGHRVGYAAGHHDLPILSGRKRVERERLKITRHGSFSHGRFAYDPEKPNETYEQEALHIEGVIKCE